MKPLSCLFVCNIMLLPGQTKVSDTEILMGVSGVARILTGVPGEIERHGSFKSIEPSDNFLPITADI